MAVSALINFFVTVERLFKQSDDCTEQQLRTIRISIIL